MVHGCPPPFCIESLSLACNSTVRKRESPQATNCETTSPGARLELTTSELAIPGSPCGGSLTVLLDRGGSRRVCATFTLVLPAVVVAIVTETRAGLLEKLEIANSGWK